MAAVQDATVIAEQCIDYRTFGNLVANALRNHLLQRFFEHLEIGDFGADAAQVIHGHVFDFRTGVVAAVDEAQEAANLFQ